MKVINFKLFYCIYLERLHRHVFDNLLLCYEDKRYKPHSFLDKFTNAWYDFLRSLPICRDFRQYLRLHKEKGAFNYGRYTGY